MDKRAIGVIFSLIAIFVLPPAMILIYNLGYYVNALSSVVIATATVIYATLTYLLLREQQREKKKQRIQEISDFVIHPRVKRLESQKSYLEKGDFGYEDKEVRYVTEFTATFWGIKKLIYDDFKVDDSKVGDNIEEHDKEVEKLKDSLKGFREF